MELPVDILRQKEREILAQIERLQGQLNGVRYALEVLVEMDGKGGTAVKSTTRRGRKPGVRVVAGKVTDGGSSSTMTTKARAAAKTPRKTRKKSRKRPKNTGIAYARKIISRLSKDGGVRLNEIVSLAAADGVTLNPRTLTTQLSRSCKVGELRREGLRYFKN